MRSVVVAAVAAAFSSAASAATLVAYDPVPSIGAIPAFIAAPTIGAAGAAPLARGAGLSQALSGGLPFGNNYNSNGFLPSGSSIADAIAAGDFLTWGFSSSRPLDLTTLDIAYGRGLSGPQSIVIQLSVNGGGYVDVFSDDAIQVGAEQNTGIDLGAFDRVLTANFRLVGVNALTAIGRFSIAESEDFLEGSTPGIVVSGGLSPVPLPAGMPLLLGALVLGYGVSRRRA